MPLEQPIDGVEVVRARNWIYVLIHTSKGITGVGEGGMWALPDASAAAIEHFTPYLLGKDALHVEHHMQNLYRYSHFRGAAVGAAISAIDIALWDITGKHYEAPIYKLWGGPTRTKVRLYMHVTGSSTDEVVASARDAVADGYTAVRFDPFLPEWPDLRYPAMIDAAVQRVEAVREAVGRDVDICVECHFKLTPTQAVTLGRRLERSQILFLEDPIPPESPATMGELAGRISVPIATGERLHNIQEFRELLASGPVAHVRPDVCLVGGLTQARKIASLAEAWHVGVIPHNPLSPVSTAACVQLDAAIPNFTIQEYMGEDESPKSDLLSRRLDREGGYIIVPEAPGLGIELDVDAARKLGPFHPKLEAPLRSDDASVVDH